MNIKDQINFISNGNATIILRYKGITIEKDENMDRFYLETISNSIGKSLSNPRVYVMNFMHTYQFYSQLCLLDPSLPKYGNVYLMANKMNKTFKIGKTYNYDVRYKEEKKKELIKCIPVYNQSQIESMLLKHFKSQYRLVDGTKETFYYDGNINIITKEFQKLIPKSKIATFKTKLTKHITNEFPTMDRQGLWVSMDVFQILVNNYIEKPSDKKDYQFLIDNVNKFIDNDSYVYNVHNDMLDTDCTYWKYHKYTIIQNEKDMMINGSRLWNSIKKKENKKIKLTLNEFLHTKFFEDKLPAFNKMFPGAIMYTENYKNKDQPQFNGVYIHPTIVHYVVDRLNAEYGFMVAIMAFKKFKKPIEVEQMISRNEVQLYKRSMKSYSQLEDLCMFMSIL